MEVLRRLGMSPPCMTYEAARAQLADTLNEVEDELTPFPYDPRDLDPNQPLRPTDRMYPVQDDNVSDVEGYPNVKKLTASGHWVFISSTGAMEIRARTNADGSRVQPAEAQQAPLLIARSGADGSGVWELSHE